MKQTIVSFLRLLQDSWKNIFWFEVFYQLVRSVLCVPAFLHGFNFLMRIQGYYYLTLENVLKFVTRPLSLLALIGAGGVLTVLSMWEILSLLYIIDAAHQHKNVSLVTIQKIVWKRMKGILNKSQIWLAFAVLLMIPLTNSVTTFGIVRSIPIPGFIRDSIYDEWKYMALFLSILFVLSWLLMRWVFSLHYFALSDDPLWDSKKESVVLGKKRKIKIFVILYSTTFLFVTIGSGILSFFVWLGTWIYQTMDINAYPVALLLAVVGLLAVFCYVLQEMLSSSFGFLVISQMYYVWNPEQSMVTYEEKKASKQRRKLSRKLKTAMLVFTVLGSGVVVHAVYQGKVPIPVEGFSKAQITAHRGASSVCPENTMYAFEEAVRLGADWIELDVQQSKDGQLFVCHDCNFKRLTGVDANAWELDYAEIRSLDVGNDAEEQYRDAYMPLLSEVISFAKEHGIKLNIELKPTGHEKDLEKAVVKLVEENLFGLDCVISSLQYPCLERVKEVNASIQTAYVGALAYGDLLRMTAADAFSLERQSTTASMVERIHHAGKQIFVWTVNDAEDVSSLLELGVDNIITDDVNMVKEEMKEESYFLRLFRSLK